MKLFSGFLLVLAFLAMSACTGDDETIELKQCHDKSTVNVTEGEECPPPEDTSNNNTSGNQGGSTGGQTDTSDTSEPDRPDCIQVKGVNLNGTDQDDVICGNDKDNTIDGLEGDDTIYGRAGNDILIGGAGNFRDTLKGEAGNDTLRGDEGIDILDGGDGTDTADYSQEQQPQPTETTPNPTPDTSVSVVVKLAEGQATDTHGDGDKLISIENVIGTPGSDTIIGDEEDNVIDGFGAPDADNPDTLDGGAGTDTIVLRGSAESFDLTNTDDTDGKAENFENITSMLTNTAAVALTGDSGPNTIIGGVGMDTIKGGAGRDILNGGEGNDIINNGPGVNTLIGGKGADEFMIDALDADADTIQDFTITERDTITCAIVDRNGNGTEDELAAFRALSKKKITVTDDREKNEITAVTVEVRATDNKRELAIYEVYSVITVAADTTASPSVDEEITERTGKLRTLVRVPGLSSNDELTFTGDCIE